MIPTRFSILVLIAAGLTACAEKTANLQLDAADRAIQTARGGRASDCAPEVFKAAESALSEARRLATAGDIDAARAKAGQAETLARQAQDASPAGCDDERTADGDDSEPGIVGGAGSGATDARAELPELESLLDTIYFDYNRAVIREASKAVLTQVAEVLRAQPTATLEIEGHCDVRGSTEYNLHLGERRARSVMKYLVTQGVDAEQLRIISYGEERPADFGFGESAHAANRRCELRRL